MGWTTPPRVYGAIKLPNGSYEWVEAGDWIITTGDLVTALRPEAFAATYAPVPDFTADGADPILQFFAYAHLPAHLQAAGEPFGILAERLAREVPRNPERTVALRKLLEAKDAAVRATLFKAA